MAANRPMAVAIRASAIPGATVAIVACFMAPSERKEFKDEFKQFHNILLVVSQKRLQDALEKIVGIARFEADLRRNDYGVGENEINTLLSDDLLQLSADTWT